MAGSGHGSRPTSPPSGASPSTPTGSSGTTPSSSLAARRRRRPAGVARARAHGAGTRDAGHERRAEPPDGDEESWPHGVPDAALDRPPAEHRGGGAWKAGRPAPGEARAATGAAARRVHSRRREPPPDPPGTRVRRSGWSGNPDPVGRGAPMLVAEWTIDADIVFQESCIPPRRHRSCGSRGGEPDVSSLLGQAWLHWSSCCAPRRRSPTRAAFPITVAAAASITRPSSTSLRPARLRRSSGWWRPAGPASSRAAERLLVPLRPEGPGPLTNTELFPAARAGSTAPHTFRAPLGSPGRAAPRRVPDPLRSWSIFRPPGRRSASSRPSASRSRRSSAPSRRDGCSGEARRIGTTVEPLPPGNPGRPRRFSRSRSGSPLLLARAVFRPGAPPPSTASVASCSRLAAVTGVIALWISAPPSWFAAVLFHRWAYLAPRGRGGRPHRASRGRRRGALGRSVGDHAARRRGLASAVHAPT